MKILNRPESRIGGTCDKFSLLRKWKVIRDWAHISWHPLNSQ
jgi:hypothetical protein